MDIEETIERLRNEVPAFPPAITRNREAVEDTNCVPLVWQEEFMEKLKTYSPSFRWKMEYPGEEEWISISKKKTPKDSVDKTLMDMLEMM
ncbi:hypothetical protein M1146_05985 [Patescibacteria group bacterium]|nr:hypothetical protein [Patescibacteria group bacterium]